MFDWEKTVVAARWPESPQGVSREEHEMSAPNLDSELSKLRIDKSRKRPGRGRLGKIAAVAVILAAAGFGYSYYSRTHAPIPVRVIQPQRDSSGNHSGAAVLTAGGYVIPRNKVEVSSQIVGRVKEILVKRGDQVKAGDVLLRLDDQDLAAQVAVAQAALASAQARLAELRAGSRPQEIAAAKAAVDSAQATLEGARLNRDRLEALTKNNVVSQQELDQARTAYGVASAAVNAAKKQAELVETGPRQEEIDAAEAQARQAEAALEYAKSQLAYTVIRAPIDGTILEKVAEKGELVTNVNFGGTRGAKSSVVTMADLHDLQVELDINENDLSRIRLGQKCEVRLDSNPGLVIRGEVDEVAPQADRQKATVQVKVRLIDPGDRVRTEVNARVTFLADLALGSKTASSAPLRVWIPRSALVNGPDGTRVYIASKGTAVARKVVTGAEGEKGVEVTEGLAGTEPLIVEPLDKITDGTRIALQ